MTFRRIAVALLVVSGCETWPLPAPMTREAHEKDYAQWREARRASLVRPGSGAVTWIGLWDLPNGSFTIGSSDSNDVLLIGDSIPPKLGTIARNDGGITFTPARDAHPMIADSVPITSTVQVVTDRSRGSTVISSGS